MNSKPKLAALASAAMLLGTSAALASDGYATYDYAQVVSSQPMINYVTVKTPVRECWEETQYYTANSYPSRNAGGTLLGAVIGGVIGHQIGSGHGNDAATVAGGLIGAAIGNDVSRRRHGLSTAEQRSRPVERCKTSYREHREERIDGYRVTYRYRGQKYVTEMPYDPGNKLRVRVDIRPAG
jgi:uncharacterized protein YcfJ